MIGYQQYRYKPKIEKPPLLMIGYQQYRYKPKIEKTSPTNDWILAIQI